MKVLFDSQIFDWQINGGISRYFIEVLKRLEKNISIDVLLKVRHSYNNYIQHTTWLDRRPVLKELHFKGKLGALKIINQKINRQYSNGILKKEIQDIFHPTYYDPYFLKYLGKKKLVITVHDLTNEKFNDHTALTKKMLVWKSKLIERADHIIAVSGNTKKDVMEYYSIPEDRITVTHLASGLAEQSFVNTNYPDRKSIPEQYILFVGSRRAYKNFNAFIQEVAPVVKKESISLVTAGGGEMDDEEMSLFKQMGIEKNVVSFSQINDNVLSWLYKNAEVFVFPSLYEGFGMPVLEALQNDCPILLSNNSSLPEVGGEAAVYFDPFIKGDLQLKLRQILSDISLRKRLVEAGKVQWKKFNWDYTADGHLNVYKKLLQ